MPETIQVTKDQLYAAFLAWESDTRAGKTITPEEARSKPLEQVAQENARSLWDALTAAQAVA